MAPAVALCRTIGCYHIMKVIIVHASKYGNGAMVAEEVASLLRDKGNVVEVHHVREMKAKKMPAADLYVLSSPGRIGKPIGKMRRFLKKLVLPEGTKMAIFSTEGQSRPKKDGTMPTKEEVEKWQRVRPIMNELLAPKKLNKVAEQVFYVTGMKGPLEEGWKEKAAEFSARLT